MIQTTRLQLTAYAWSRMFGGLGYAGFIRAYTKSVLMVSLPLCVQLIVLRLFHPECFLTDTCSALEGLFREGTLSCYIIALALVVTEILIKPFAAKLEVTDELKSLAKSGVPEAAFALSDLHMKSQSYAHSLMWMKLAEELGHPSAKKGMLKLEKHTLK